MGAAEKMDEKYTYQDYLNWSIDERWELIEGLPYNMSPAPSRKHQGILKKLSFSFESFLQNKPCQMYFAPLDVRFSEDTVVQPDIIVVCDESQLNDRGCLGAPDLVIEIISPATAIRDTKIKLDLYEKYGVREYWIVYPEEKIVMVFKLNEKKEYGKPETYSKEDKIQSFILPEME
ncbi:MAG TPA: Uma2 family endonuclease, partial [Spirochaetia bacterium]|nr:Uma2 family endonuclease [Spirochaetia bacterium]